MNFSTIGKHLCTGLAIAVLFVSQGCSNNHALQSRITELEQRVNNLESTIAKWQGGELNPQTISLSPSQGIMSSSPAPSQEKPGNIRPAKPNYQAYSGRCQATTKKGTQCKRQASAGSSYCWQH